MSREGDPAPGAAISEGEARFDRWRARAGWVLAPLAAATVAWWPFETLSPQAHILAAINVAVVVLWVSEALPLWVPAVLGPACAFALGVADAPTAFGPFAHDLILLFLGGFVLAAGLAARGVDRRVALWMLARPWVDGRPDRARMAIALVAFGFSMWISNTATTAMMVPIALGLCARMHPPEASAPGAAQPGTRDYTEGVLLTLAYAASLGGLCTPIGTAPNMLAVNHFREHLGVELDFVQWMSFALPVALLALLAVLGLARLRYPALVPRIEDLRERMLAASKALGPVRPSERRVVAVFGLAVLLWVLPAGLRLALGDSHPATTLYRAYFKEGWVAVACAATLLVLPNGDADARGSTANSQREPLLRVRQAVQIDWGTLALLGGGFSLGKMTFSTGLAAAIGDGILSIAPPGQFGLLAVSTTLVLYLTELTSNTATTSMMLPVITPAALAAGLDPMPIALCVTMAASFAFMMPVSTPPNAIVYGTRRVKFMQMVRFGAWMDLIGLALLLGVGAWLLPALLA